MNSKWIPIKERKPDRSCKNILVKTKNGVVGFAYYERYLPKEFNGEILPREEFLKNCKQVFTGIPVVDIDGISIYKEYNSADIEYWMYLEDAADNEKWRFIDCPSEKGCCEDVLILNADGSINVGRMIVDREMAFLSTKPINGAIARGKKYKVFLSKYCGRYENLMFLSKNENVVAWQHLPD
jgi:hypothetical protein